jgi:hypothetical protein
MSALSSGHATKLLRRQQTMEPNSRLAVHSDSGRIVMGRRYLDTILVSLAVASCYLPGAFV